MLFRSAPEEKERLKKQLTEELEKDFRTHLKESRSQLEDMKRRTEHLEKELQRRENNLKEAVAALADAMIRGEKPSRGPDSRLNNREKLEK